MQRFFLISLLLILFVGCDVSNIERIQQEPIRAVSGLGVAVGKYNIVDLTLSASASNTKSKWARIHLNNTMHKLKKALSELKAGGVVFDDSETTTTFDLSKVWDWDDGKKIFKGFKAKMTMHLRTKNVDKMSAIVDKLATVHNLEMKSPTFLVSDAQVDKLHRSAFKTAVQRAKERFDNECETLGLKSTNFKITSWNARYDSSQNAWDEGASLASAGDMRLAQKVTIQSGKPKIFVRVTLQYK